MNKLTSNYINVLQTLKEKIRQARLNAVIRVNVELLKLYWEIGRIIFEQEKIKGWGSKVVEKLSKDLSSEFPDMKGFSSRNLRYMRDFYLAYPEFRDIDTQKILQTPPAKLQETDIQKDTILQDLLAKLSWYHHTTLLDKIKDRETRLFYIQETVKNGWSRDVMVHQIESKLHLRKGKILSNFKNTIAPDQSELTQQLFKDPYKFEFIYLGKEANERDLEDALTNQLTKFLLELGQYFAFLGRQYKITLGDKEYFFDLLFYHTRLKRYIIIDLKIDEFKPEYKGKMEFYLNLADEYLKQDNDESSIGLILCKTKDKLVVEYALKDSKKPIGIAEYKISETLPSELRGEMPTVEELEAQIEKGLQEFKKPLDIKYERLKQLINEIKQPEIKERKNPKTSLNIFRKVVLPLKDTIKNGLSKITKEFKFNKVEIIIWTDNQANKTVTKAQAYLKKHKVVNEYKIDIHLKEFKLAGKKSFDIWKSIYITTYPHSYTIGFNRDQRNCLVEKLYHELPDEKEFENIFEKLSESVLDEIIEVIEKIKN
jgi:predicted nuclease of restriction endonuclease-like (RecB) superfamily